MARCCSLWRARRQPLHALRARRAAADLQPRRALPQAGAAGRSCWINPRRLMKLTRRQVLAGAAAGVVGAAGIYELVDQLAAARRRAPPAAARSPEQHLLDGIRIVKSRRRRGARAAAPPRDPHGAASSPTAPTSRDAQSDARRTCSTGSTRDYAPTPAGLGVTVGVGAAVLRAARRRTRLRALSPARPPRRASRCSSTPSASRATRPTRGSSRTTSRSCCAPTCAPTSTTRRSACATRSSSSSRRSAAASRAAASTAASSLPKQMAVDAAQIPGADLIPDTAELFLGFTSTQRAGMGPGQDRELRDARLRRLPRQRLLPPRHAHAPVAHPRGPRGVVPQLRLRRARRDGVPPEPRRAGRARRRCAQGPKDVSTAADVRRDYRSSGRIGHSASIQTTSRLERDVVAADGTRLPEGRGDPGARRLQHARQPVLLVGARATRSARCPAAGVHFVVFNPTGDDFRATGSRWTACCPAARSRSRRATATRASTRSSRRRTARTSSCRRGGTAASRSPSSSRTGSAQPNQIRVEPTRTGSGSLRNQVPSQPTRRTCARRRTSRRARSSARPSPPRASTEITSSPRSAAIWPNAPSATRSAAFSPKRVARIAVARRRASRRAGRGRAP